jgi:YHS domain-containing protein
MASTIRRTERRIASAWRVDSGTLVEREIMTDERDTDRGVPGEGKGRRDEVGRSGIWPASGPLPPGSDVPIVGQDELAHGPRPLHSEEMPAGASAFETDPVCGARINTAAAERGDYNGHAYYFDSIDCRLRFEETPDRYATIPDRREP